MDYTELRRHPRVNVDFFADWGWGPECSYYDKITSLSLSGCFLATKRDLARGDQIYLRVKADGAGLITLTGTVCYQLRVREDAPPTGAGVEFIGMTNDHQTRLQIVMNSYRM